MDSPRPRVLMLGDIDHREFGEALGWLREHTDLKLAHTIDNAIEAERHESEHWHTLILAQARPGQFSSRDIDRLSRTFPLAQQCGWAV